jgi:DUF2934 family protein
MKPKEVIRLKSEAAVPIPTTNAPTERSVADVQEQIRCRAYGLYEQRGREDGHYTEDLLQAESEVIHGAQTKAAA